MAAARYFLRPGRVEDLSLLLRLEEQSFPGDRLSRRSLRRLMLTGTAAVVVSEVAGQVAGCVIVLFRRGSKRARIYSLCVSAACRGMGLGEALMREAESSARQRGCESIHLEVRSDNAGAMRLYERLGYRIYARRPGYYDDGMEAACWEKGLL